MITARRPTRSLAARVMLVVMAAVVATVTACGPSATVEIGKGKPVPNITGTTLDGATLDLSTLRGHPVLINFWGPSCEPCRLEMPLLAKKAAEHAAGGLVIVGVLTDDPVEPARTFESDFGATWQTVIDPGGAIKS
ncbi:MAG: TlpA disulfide reductase family protein, partial [Candidatus Limnocylindrales bacterium]